jgi:tRNA(adenine34) deaminase
MSYDCGRPRGLSRRSVVTGFVAAAAMPMASAGLEAPAAHPTAEDERFMRMAIEEARRADFPFGAVIVRNGRVIARAQSWPPQRWSNRAWRDGGDSPLPRSLRSLQGATIYTSGEPCAMCMGAILWSHMGRMVFAASLEQLATKIDQIMVTSAELAAKATFAPIAITGGVLADDAMKLFPNKP